MAQEKTIVIIAGPTAVGKTALAIDLAKRINAEIISADSRQCYKELNIGVARPSAEQLREVPHHFIASHSIHDTVNAGTFSEFALAKASELFRSGDYVVMTGGTGLYLRAFTEGIDEMPQIPDTVRQAIVAGYELKGLAWLQERVKEKDPRFYNVGEIQNPQRLMRALEVAESTGRSILDFRSGKKQSRDFKIVKVGLQLPMEELRRNIGARTDEMIREGLVEEVKNLLSFRGLNALQTVGYTELFDYLDGELSLDEAVERIKINTRQYAKRQLTWFRRDKEIRWYSPVERDKIIDLFA